MKPSYWFLRHSEGQGVLCNDGVTRRQDNPENFKKYVYHGNAQKRANQVFLPERQGLSMAEFSCIAVYEGDIVHPNGDVDRHWK